MTAPKVVLHDGIYVVRDDLFAGGTKARYLPALFAHTDELVYASPAEGGAQTALAYVARELCKRATIFVAQRSTPHPRAVLAREWGANVVQVPHGYLNVVQAAARRYCADTGATLAPFGLNIPEAPPAIAAAARATGLLPDEVWCAGGSGVLARGLALAWPGARRHVVQVGRKLDMSDVCSGTVHTYPRPFDKHAWGQPPFPSDPHYDAKAWEYCAARHGAGTVVFWNVTSPA